MKTFSKLILSVLLLSSFKAQAGFLDSPEQAMNATLEFCANYASKIGIATFITGLGAYELLRTPATILDRKIPEYVAKNRDNGTTVLEMQVDIFLHAGTVETGHKTKDVEITETECIKARTLDELVTKFNNLNLVNNEKLTHFTCTPSIFSPVGEEIIRNDWRKLVPSFKLKSIDSDFEFFSLPFNTILHLKSLREDLIINAMAKVIKCFMKKDEKIVYDSRNGGLKIIPKPPAIIRNYTIGFSGISIN